jgi:hypothetical protein
MALILVSRAQTPDVRQLASRFFFILWLATEYDTNTGVDTFQGLRDS